MKNKQKSLMQLAKELRVSRFYLLQLKHSKRPASAKVLSIKLTPKAHRDTIILMCWGIV